MYAHNETDKLIEHLERAIKREYRKAVKDIEKQIKANEALLMFEDAKRKASMKPKAYNAWRMAKIAQNKRLKAMEDELVDYLLKARENANFLATGYMQDAFALNTNYTIYSIEKQSMVDLSFAVYNKQTVETLIKDNPQLLPMTDKVKQAIKRREFKAWSRKKISSAITQGILHGEDIRHISKRLKEVASMTQASSIRNARTAMTAAENSGRQVGYDIATDKGLKIRKQWLAVHDMRTRHEHRILDGQIVDVDKPFRVEGYEINYPADPTAEAFLVYNCRCTMVAVFNGFEPKAQGLPLNLEINNLSYEEWEKLGRRHKHES